MTDNQSFKLIKIYFIISDLYNNILKYHCQRFSNNSVYEFTDIEIITIYLYSMIEEKRFSNKGIHSFAQRYLFSWFPKIPSYVAFNTRLNNLASVFEILVDVLTVMQCPDDCNFDFSLLDSLPIITCSGKRQGKVATNLTDKGFCSTKGIYYFGLKLHLLAFQQKNKIPYPESFVITQASENDMNVFKQYWSNISNRTFFGDKIYYNTDFFEKLFQELNSIMLTPIKMIKGQCDDLKKRGKAFNDFFSKVVSKVRQPIESFFSWLIQKTDIQRASKVRSDKGLIVHVFGRISAALLCF